jgi:hypothetical protein
LKADNQMKGIGTRFISFFGVTPDEQYFDEKATEVQYLGRLFSGEVVCAPSLMGLTLQERAKVSVGAISYDQLLRNLDIDTSYSTLTQVDMMFAVSVGFIGVLAAHYTNAKSEELEEFFKELHGKYKLPTGPSPTDYRAGARHRYVFGHDLNIFQKLPAGHTYSGEDVGGRTLYSLVLGQMKALFPDAGFIGGHVKAIMHLLTHYLSDLPTKDGLPLPFSSLFTDWEENLANTSGYSAKNPLMDALGREYGTINMADISTYATIKLILKGHNLIAFRSKAATKDEQSLHLAQMSTIAYGSAVIVQMLMLLGGIGGRTGKLNYLIACPFVWNAGKIVLILNRQNREIIRDYDHSIAMLDDQSVTFDEWVKNQCV